MIRGPSRRGGICIILVKILSIVFGEDILWENGECGAIGGGRCDVLDGLGVVVFWVEILFIVSEVCSSAVMSMVWLYHSAGKLMEKD